MTVALEVQPKMTTTYGLATKVTLLGASSEGLAIARWAAANRGKVACLYMDKAVCDFKSWPGGKLGVGKGSPAHWENLKALYGFASDKEALAYPWNPIDLAAKLVSANVPILYLAGEQDETVPFPENGGFMQKEYKRLGGLFELIMHDGEGHHPQGSPDPQPVIEFVERHSQILHEAEATLANVWRPVEGHLMTRWAKDVNPNQPLSAYPRPQMTRKRWKNLNGLWDYKIQSMYSKKPFAFDGKILVPFPIESALSGVKKPVWKDERLWYRTVFHAPTRQDNERVLLHFGAIDWEAKVYLNDVFLGVHRGGYDAFTFDITDAVRVGRENELVVAVYDATGAGQATGKQNFNKIHKPGGIAYTPCTGLGKRCG
ncbi:MAG: sugar-binding domain-containing protein [Pirellula sp.]